MLRDGRMGYERIGSNEEHYDHIITRRLERAETFNEAMVTRLSRFYELEHRSMLSEEAIAPTSVWLKINNESHHTCPTQFLVVDGFCILSTPVELLTAGHHEGPRLFSHNWLSFRSEAERAGPPPSTALRLRRSSCSARRRLLVQASDFKKDMMTTPTGQRNKSTGRSSNSQV